MLESNQVFTLASGKDTCLFICCTLRPAQLQHTAPRTTFSLRSATLRCLLTLRCIHAALSLWYYVFFNFCSRSRSDRRFMKKGLLPCVLHSPSVPRGFPVSVWQFCWLSRRSASKRQPIHVLIRRLVCPLAGSQRHVTLSRVPAASSPQTTTAYRVRSEPNVLR